MKGNTKRCRWNPPKYSYSKDDVEFVKNIPLFPAVFVSQLLLLGLKYLLQNAVEGPLKNLQVCIIYLIASWAKSLCFFQACDCYRFHIHKSFPENRDRQVPSFGTFLAYDY